VDFQKGQHVPRIISIVDTMEKKLHLVFGWLAGVVVVAGLTMVVLNVFLRYLLHGSAPWADEYVGYSVLASAMLAASYTLVEEKHVRVDIITRLLPKKAQGWLEVAVCALSLFASMLLTSEGWKFAYGNWLLKARADTVMETPLFPIQIFIPIGFALLSIALLSRIIRTIRALIRSEWKEPTTGKAH
jgi:C4-dicarboxylate transporter DctQ subunit